ncbi:MAG: class I SAM-dependent methyltransferase [Acidimicrobiales bacterium]
MPVLCNALFATGEEARNATVGSIDLVLCDSCGLVWNAAFDQSAVAYSPAYENSLHFSPRFRAFATDLARDLVRRHALAGRTVLEIGSGKGDFLELLCDAGVARGIGYDPSYAGDMPARPSLRFVPSLFPERAIDDADFVCARHVLEHLSAPARLMRNLRQAIPARRRVGFYIEVPDGTYLLRTLAIWDVIYEHPLHYTAQALTRLLADAGLPVTRVLTCFGDQYLAAEGATDSATPVAPADDRRALRHLASEFAHRAADLRNRWVGRLTTLLDAGPVALWGAGSKGVTFLATVPGADEVAAVVDVNPRKWGRHVPLTGHVVVPPSDLRRLRPAAVVLLNPMYQEEVEATMAESGIDASLVIDPS